jgi:hypothetical protein
MALLQLSSHNPQHRLDYDFDDANFLRINLQDYIRNIYNHPYDQNKVNAINQLFRSMFSSGSLLLKYIAWCSGEIDGILPQNEQFNAVTFNNIYMPFLRCLAVSLRYDTAHDFTVVRGTDKCKHDDIYVLGSALGTPGLHGWLYPPLLSNHFKQKLIDKFQTPGLPPPPNILQFIANLKDVEILSDPVNPGTFATAAANLQFCSYHIQDTGIKKNICTIKTTCPNITKCRTIFSMIDSAGCGKGSEPINFFITLQGQIFLYNIGLIFFQSFYTIMREYSKNNPPPAPPAAAAAAAAAAPPAAAAAAAAGVPSSFYIYIKTPDYYANFQAFQSGLKAYYLRLNRNHAPNAYISTRGGSKNIFAVNSACNLLKKPIKHSVLNAIFSIPNINNIRANIHNAIFCIMKGYGDFGQLFYVNLMSSIQVLHEFFIDDISESKNIVELHGQNVVYNPLYKDCILETVDTYLMKLAFVCKTNFITATPDYRYYLFDNQLPTPITDAITFFKALTHSNYKHHIKTTIADQYIRNLGIVVGGCKHINNKCKKGKNILQLGAAEGDEEMGKESEILNELIKSTEIYSYSYNEGQKIELQTYDEIQRNKEQKINEIITFQESPEADLENKELPGIIYPNKIPRIESLNVLYDLYDTIKVHTFQLYKIDLKIDDKGNFVFVLIKQTENGEYVEINSSTSNISSKEDFFLAQYKAYKDIYSTFLDLASESAIKEFIIFVIDHIDQILLFSVLFLNKEEYEKSAIIENLNTQILNCKKLESTLAFFCDFYKDILKIALLNILKYDDNIIRSFIEKMYIYIGSINDYLEQLQKHLESLCEFLKEKFYETDYIEDLFENIINLLNYRIEEINNLREILEQRYQQVHRQGGKKYKKISKLLSSQKIYNNLYKKNNSFLQRGGTRERDLNEYYNCISLKDNLLYDKYHVLLIRDFDFDFIEAIKISEFDKKKEGLVTRSLRMVGHVPKPQTRTSVRSLPPYPLPREYKTLMAKTLMPKTSRGGVNYSKTDELKLDKSIKKYINILGRKRCIYTKIGSKKEYIKTKNQFVLIKDFIKLHSKNSIKPSKIIKDTKLQTLPKPKVNKASQEAQKDIKISPKPKSTPKVNKASQETEKDINISPKSKPKVNKASLEAQKDINISPKPKSKPKVNKASQETEKDINISPKSKPKVNKASLEAQKDINISPKPKSKPKVNKVK